jgi:hypothetical protein
LALKNGIANGNWNALAQQTVDNKIHQQTGLSIVLIVEVAEQTQGQAMALLVNVTTPGRPRRNGLFPAAVRHATHMHLDQRGISGPILRTF